VIPVSFDYVRAASAAEAVALLTEHGDEAKLLAGGHSLLPLMKLRLATPAVLIDVARIDDLSYIRDEGTDVAIGALTRHHVVERDPLLLEHLPLLAHATSQVGDPQVRHRGTLGGALAHGDPASDLPAAALALGATLVAEGPSGRREIPADEFFTGFLETALADDELLVEVRIPKATGAGWSFQKFNRRAMDWAIVGVAAVHAPDGIGTGIGLVNMDNRPVRAAAAEAAVVGGASAADAAEQAPEDLDPPEDANASVEFRQHLARVLVRRALDEAGVA
jgi:carbon-monoxide dehydrogenase medium subunit